MVNAQTQDNEGLINLVGESSYIADKRLYTLGNFSRFIRPGYYRVGSSVSPAAGLSMSAYKDPKTGQFAVVEINSNPTAEPLSVSGLPAADQSATPYVTSAAKNLAKEAPVAIKSGTFSATLAPMSVTIFVGG